MNGFANPPFNLISRILAKTRREKATITLIAPLWRTTWTNRLLEMTIDEMYLGNGPSVFTPNNEEAAKTILCNPEWTFSAFRISGLLNLAQS